MAVYGLVGDPTLSEEALWMIRGRLNDLIAEIGPRDRHGILLLSHQQREAIEAFHDWLQDAFGGDDDDT